jgi:hypothetical protein
MQKVSVKVKRLEHFRGDLPGYGSLHASGFDLRAQLKAPLVLGPASAFWCLRAFRWRFRLVTRFRCVRVRGGPRKRGSRW